MNWSQQKSAFRFLAAGLLIILMAAVAQSNTLASIDPPPEKPFVPELGGFTEYEGSLVLDQNASGQVLADPDTEFDGLIEPETTPLGWVTTMSQGFEGVSLPSGWTVYDNDGATNGELFWGSQSNSSMVHDGDRSAWPGIEGADGRPPGFGYANNMDSWMVYGPFSLADANDAYFNFLFSAQV